MISKSVMEFSFFYALSILLLSSCDYRIRGNITNKTDSDIRIRCYLVEKNRWDTLKGPSLTDYESLTGGAYFVVNEINKGEDSRFIMVNDSIYDMTLSPNASLYMNMVMNHFWTEKRLRSYLQFLKRLDIQMLHDTIVYNGATELNDFFWKHKQSKQEIRINIRDNLAMKLVDKLF